MEAKQRERFRLYTLARDRVTAARLAYNADRSDANRRAYENAADDFDDMRKPRGWKG